MAMYIQIAMVALASLQSGTPLTAIPHANEFWFWGVLGAVLFTAIIELIFDWIDLNTNYDDIIRSHYDQSTCPDKDAITNRLWGHIPLSSSP